MVVKLNKVDEDDHQGLMKVEKDLEDAEKKINQQIEKDEKEGSKTTKASKKTTPAPSTPATYFGINSTLLVKLV